MVFVFIIVNLPLRSTSLVHTRDNMLISSLSLNVVRKAQNLICDD